MDINDLPTVVRNYLNNRNLVVTAQSELAALGFRNVDDLLRSVDEIFASRRCPFPLHKGVVDWTHDRPLTTIPSPHGLDYDSKVLMICDACGQARLVPDVPVG